MTQPENLPLSISIRRSIEADIPIYFQMERDRDARWMAAFTSDDPDDEAKVSAHWQKIITSDKVHSFAVLLDRQVVGNVSAYDLFGERTVGYWIERSMWGRGIATTALGLYLAEHGTIQLAARVVEDNVRSIRVLEKQGFVRVGGETAFASGRQATVTELIFRRAPS